MSSETLSFTGKTGRSKNSPTCENAVARAHRSWMLRVMGSCWHGVMKFPIFDPFSRSKLFVPSLRSIWRQSESLYTLSCFAVVRVYWGHGIVFAVSDSNSERFQYFAASRAHRRTHPPIPHPARIMSKPILDLLSEVGNHNESQYLTLFTAG